MEMRELVRFFTLTVERIKATGEVFADKKIQRVHFNPEAGITPKEKQVIAAQLNGAYTRSLTIQKIIAAKQELQLQGKKITNRAVARVIQMDEKTVGKYMDATQVDMDYEVSLWN
jgi:5-bromo-4-chloroindolyl phosphate hydrolysis protein